MAFRFIHTADWQVGKVFNFVDSAEMGGLQLARLEAISRIGALANEHDVNHILVAGDIFDHSTPSTRTRNQVIERMRENSSIQWHLLPGNHDPYRPNGMWDQIQRRGLPNNVHTHTKPGATVIAPNSAVLLPAPLQHRRTVNDPTAWMDHQVSESGLIRIGLAHGAVHGFDSNEKQRANPIDPERPQLAKLEYLALGDWHRELKVNERCWYSGTPETDSFQTFGNGGVLLVEIDGPTWSPRVTLLPTGQYQWESLNERIENLADVDFLERKLRNLHGKLNRTLVNLKLSGALSLADLGQFDERIAEGVAAALYHLRIDRQHLFPEPTDDDLDGIDPGGIVRAAADRLRSKVDAGEGDADLARAALHRLYIEHKKLESRHR